MDFEDLDRDDFAAAIGDDRPRIDWSHAYRGDTVESRFEIRNADDAEWTLAELLRWRDEVEQVDGRAKTYAARLKAWKAKRRQRPAVIVEHLEQLLTDYGRKVREASEGKVTHIDVPSGRIQTTEKSGTWSVANPEVLLKWVDAWLPAEMRDQVVVRSIDVDALREYVDVDTVTIDLDDADVVVLNTRRRISVELLVDPDAGDDDAAHERVELEGVEWIDSTVSVSARRVDWTS